MGKITLRFVAGHSLVDETIKRFEYGFWADHAEAVLPDGKTIIGAYLGTGVAKRPRDFDKGDFDEDLYVEIDVTDEQQDAFYAFLEQQVGKPYDTKAVIGIGLARNWRDDGQWFCSELQCAALTACGVFPTHLADQLNHVTPRDLLLIVSGRVLVGKPQSAATA
jgi:hypothetical protein